jgi:hypothetical protein
MHGRSLKAPGELMGGNWMKAKGDYQAQVHSDQMVLVIVRWRGSSQKTLNSMKKF